MSLHMLDRKILKFQKLPMKPPCWTGFTSYTFITSIYLSSLFIALFHLYTCVQYNAKTYSSWVIGVFCSWHMALFLPIDHQCCHNSQQLVQRWIAHEVLRKGLLFSRAPLYLSHLSLYGKTGILGKGGWPFPKTATLSHCVPFRQE